MNYFITLLALALLASDELKPCPGSKSGKPPTAAGDKSTFSARRLALCPKCHLTFAEDQRSFERTVT